MFTIPFCPTAFVYFGILPVDSESSEAKLLIPYALGVLDALEIKNGATHCEIMMTDDGPCLVVSSRTQYAGVNYYFVIFWTPLMNMFQHHSLFTLGT